MELCDVLSARRRAIKMSFDELNQKTNVPVSTLKKIFTGVTTNPSLESIRAIAYAMGLTLDDLDGESGVSGLTAEENVLLNNYRNLDAHGKRVVNFIVEAETDRCKEERERREQTQPVLRLVKMPVYDDPAAAGEPLSAESGYEYVEFSAEAVPNGAEFGVRISGESMGETVPDGCVAFVRRSERAGDGDVVIATLRGEGTVCKRLVTDGDRLLRLHSDNTDYPDIEGDSLNDLKIHGVVVGHT